MISTAPPPLPAAKATEPLLTKQAAAESLGVCQRTIDNLVARGLLPLVKIGTASRIDPIDLRRFVESSKTSVAS